MIESPCIKVCKVDKHGICVGCFRSIEEIGQWYKMIEKQKQQVIENTKQRRPWWKQW